MQQVPPRPRLYTQADLWPPTSGDFPLAAFYPVYLGNFWCQQPTELAGRVQAYFASRGLLARLVFARDSDPFRNLQTENNLYDCLVYFCRPEDAQDAGRFLHRELYYGHRVNIFPGRDPVFFDASRTIKYNILNHSHTVTEQVLENDLASKAAAQVVCIVKHAERDIYVEFANPANMQQVMTGYWFCAPNPVDPYQQPKQRFLEQDVRGELIPNMHQLLTTQMPSQQVLDALFRGTNPPVLPPDCHQSRVVKVVMKIRGRKSNKTKKDRQVARALQRNFGSRATFADSIRPGQETVVQRAMRKVQAKAEKRGMDMAQWWSLFPDAEQIYHQTAAGNPRDRIPYVRYRTPPEADHVPYTYDDLFNLGLKYIAYVRPKHRY